MQSGNEGMEDAESEITNLPARCSSGDAGDHARRNARPCEMDAPRGLPSRQMLRRRSGVPSSCSSEHISEPK
ncbi:hypothetical protein HPP92_008039 [Vanilla planifolia]|uniref:Uncharacterized protein n=1 Tax=Vanilla planifolia TaxID=51239 RepID=A0A835RLR2_VANPL|nr:hypothetical protein HPP92_008039 [Vanilla planifolia]